MDPPDQTPSICVKIIGVFFKEISVFGHLQISFDQYIDNLSGISLVIHHIILFTLL